MLGYIIIIISVIKLVFILADWTSGKSHRNNYKRIYKGGYDHHHNRQYFKH